MSPATGRFRVASAPAPSASNAAISPEVLVDATSGPVLTNVTEAACGSGLDVRLQTYDGKVAQAVPKLVRELADEGKGHFGLMQLDWRHGSAPKKEAIAAAKRSSESMALAAKRDLEAGYRPVKPGELAFNPGQGSSSQPESASLAKSDHTTPSARRPLRLRRPRPKGPRSQKDFPTVDTKEEQARLLTGLRSVNPLMVVNQLCKAIAYFGGIPGAPPPADGAFPPSTKDNGSGCLFIGWMAEIFPRPRSENPDRDHRRRVPQNWPKTKRTRYDRGTKKGPAGSIHPVPPPDLSNFDWDHEMPDDGYFDAVLEGSSWMDLDDIDNNDFGGVFASGDSPQGEGTDFDAAFATPALEDPDLSGGQKPMAQPTVADEPAVAQPAVTSQLTVAQPAAPQPMASLPGSQPALVSASDNPTPTTRRRGRPKGSKNRPKGVTATSTKAGSSGQPPATHSATTAPDIAGQPQSSNPRPQARSTQKGRPKGSKNRPKPPLSSQSEAVAPTLSANSRAEEAREDTVATLRSKDEQQRQQGPSSEEHVQRDDVTQTPASSGFLGSQPATSRGAAKGAKRRRSTAKEVAEASSMAATLGPQSTNSMAEDAPRGDEAPSPKRMRWSREIIISNQAPDNPDGAVSSQQSGMPHSSPTRRSETMMPTSAGQLTRQSGAQGGAATSTTAVPRQQAQPRRHSLSQSPSQPQQLTVQALAPTRTVGLSATQQLATTYAPQSLSQNFYTQASQHYAPVPQGGPKSNQQLSRSQHRTRQLEPQARSGQLMRSASSDQFSAATVGRQSSLDPRSASSASPSNAGYHQGPSQNVSQSVSPARRTPPFGAPQASQAPDAGLAGFEGYGNNSYLDMSSLDMSTSRYAFNTRTVRSVADAARVAYASAANLGHSSFDTSMTDGSLQGRQY